MTKWLGGVSTTSPNTPQTLQLSMQVADGLIRSRVKWATPATHSSGLRSAERTQNLPMTVDQRPKPPVTVYHNVNQPLTKWWTFKKISCIPRFYYDTILPLPTLSRSTRCYTLVWLPEDGGWPPKQVAVVLYYLYVFVCKGADNCFTAHVRFKPAILAINRSELQRGHQAQR